MFNGFTTDLRQTISTTNISEHRTKLARRSPTILSEEQGYKVRQKGLPLFTWSQLPARQEQLYPTLPMTRF